MSPSSRVRLPSCARTLPNAGACISDRPRTARMPSSSSIHFRATQRVRPGLRCSLRTPSARFARRVACCNSATATMRYSRRISTRFGPLHGSADLTIQPGANFAPPAVRRREIQVLDLRRKQRAFEGKVFREEKFVIDRRHGALLRRSRGRRCGDGGSALNQLVCRRARCADGRFWDTAR